MQRTITIKTLLFLLLNSLANVSYGQNVETINYANGDVYVGEIRNGELNGQGITTFANGSVYVGEFRGDQYNGQGTFTFADGTVSRGIWRDNELITKSDN